MPASPHEVLVATLREQPSLLVALVHALTGRALAPGLEPVDSTVRFVKVAEVRPDVLLAHARRWALVEVQNAPNPDKQRRWLLAAGVLLDQQRVLGDVIVITGQPLRGEVGAHRRPRGDPARHPAGADPGGAARRAPRRANGCSPRSIRSSPWSRPGRSPIATGLRRKGWWSGRSR